LTADDLQGLGAYQVVAHLFAAGSTQPPVTGRTRPLPPVSADQSALRERSRRRYGVAREAVEAAIRARQQSGERSAPVGRRAHQDRQKDSP
jgi:hypothetical protein